MRRRGIIEEQDVDEEELNTSYFTDSNDYSNFFLLFSSFFSRSPTKNY
jgi:hypothetical protein